MTRKFCGLQFIKKEKHNMLSLKHLLIIFSQHIIIYHSIQSKRKTVLWDPHEGRYCTVVWFVYPHGLIQLVRSYIYMYKFEFVIKLYRELVNLYYMFYIMFWQAFPMNFIKKTFHYSWQSCCRPTVNKFWCAHFCPSALCLRIRSE